METVGKLRATMKAMVEDDALWELIETQAGLDTKRRAANDAAAKRIASIRVK